MLRHQWDCNPIMYWLGRELGWDLLSEKIKIGSKKIKRTFSFFFRSSLSWDFKS